ncbi:MAG: hydroxymethylbilane synthase [Planctomycetaceae bacterium]
MTDTTSRSGGSTPAESTGVGSTNLSRPIIVRIATRTSRLALWQAEFTANLLRRLTQICLVEIVPISTVGDRDQESRLSSMGGQGVFTREVQRALLDGRADIAVHSLKDLPTVPTPGLVLGCVPRRGDRFDALVFPKSHPADSLESLSSGAKVATGSPRRQSQLLAVRPDLKLCEVRGNVETRLRKLDDGEFDAMILAEAGLLRLGFGDRINTLLMPPVMLPAVGQAALGIECREDNTQLRHLLSQLTDRQTWWEVLAERACLRTLQAGCHAPVGTFSSFDDDGQQRLDTVVLSHDGTEVLRASVSAPVQTEADAISLGNQTAQALLDQNAARLITPE